MPTLNIEGRRVKVDDSFLSLSPEAQQATVEEIAASLGITSSQKPTGEVSGLRDQLVAGFEQPTEDIGVSMEEAGKSLGLEGLQGAGSRLRNMADKPKNFVSASERFMNPKPGDSYVDPIAGFGWGNLAGAAAEQVGGYAGSIAARGAGALAGGGLGAVSGPQGAAAGAAVGAFAGPAFFEFLRQVGPNAKAIARNNGREDPTWDEWAQAAATAGASGVLEAIGIKGLGKLNQSLKQIGGSPGSMSHLRVIGDAAKETAGKALKEGATETGQSVIQQYGTSAGTKAGANIDLKQALGEGILGTTAGGAIDATRQVPSVIRNVNDVKAVEAEIVDNPFAREEAEIVKGVNDLARRPTQKWRELQGAEITAYVNDLKNQANAILQRQGLSSEDKRTLLQGLNTAKGLTDKRLDEIAGRSQNPEEIKAIAQQIQLIRSMTVQQQAHKGARGWLGQGVRSLGTIAGGAIGGYFGGIAGGAAGAEIGRNWSREVSQRITNAQTQGARIDALVGKKQMRRAELLLQRYGPSAATRAMETLTTRATELEAEREAEAAALEANRKTAEEFKAYERRRAELIKAIEQAKSREEKAKAQEEKKKHDLAHRELRLQNLSLDAAYKAARNQATLAKLEAQKSLSALTIEAAKVKADLQQKTAEAKAESMDRKKAFEIENLKGQMEKLSLEIQKRQEVLKKAQIATARAEKVSELTPVKAAKTMAKIKSMGSKWYDAVQQNTGIYNPQAYMSTVDYLDPLRQKAQSAIDSEPDPKLRNLLRETLSDMMSLKNNWEARWQRYGRALSDAKPLGEDAVQKVKDLFLQLAKYKAGEFGGSEDFGSTNDLDPDTEIPF